MALTIGTGGAGGGILTPQPERIVDVTNYTDLVTLGDKQLLTDYDENLVERFGVQSIQGFLAKTSAEFPLVADQVEWHEEGRLHLFYESVTYSSTASSLTFASPGHAIRVGQVLLVSDGDQEILAQAKTSASNSATVMVVDFYTSDSGLSTTANACTVRVIGSEFAKGSTGMEGSVETETKGYSNAPGILKDRYAVSGSDTAQIGWIKVEGGAQAAAFNGNGGWLWYLKSEMDNRKRFEDYLETWSLEIKKASGGDTLAAGGKTEGIFAAVEARGITATGGFDDNSFSAGVADFDKVLKELDKQGGVQENLLYLNRDENLAIDNILSLSNGYGAGGRSWGAFNNSADMALNLGFMSWHRGSYTFHKTDWKYLNDLTGRSQFTGDEIKGMLTPAGSMNVYDQGLGGTAKRPYLHIRYRASQTDNRKMKTWITGSVGAKTSDLDAMEVNYLSERCPIVQGANNFMIFKG